MTFTYDTLKQKLKGWGMMRAEEKRIYTYLKVLETDIY